MTAFPVPNSPVPDDITQAQRDQALAAHVSEWLSTLEQRHPSAIELGLERVGEVADRLAVRDFSCPVITVAGTNGKGSTVATVVAIARAAGWRVASYTSPHLVRFHERICCDGAQISDADLIAALDAVDGARGDTSLTYFEHTTLAALWWFQRQNPDLVVLEVGLGGRLDAVNIVDPTISVITTIGLDHTDWLGTDLASIAREKAGIMRPGRPVVLGEREPQPVLLAQAQALSAPVWQKGRDFDFVVKAEQGAWQYGDWLLPLPAVAIDNAATAIAALQVLLSPPMHPTSVSQPHAAPSKARQAIGVAEVAEGLRQVHVAGRMQRLSWSKALAAHMKDSADAPELILDVAHNPQGAEFLWQHIAPLPAPGRTFAVLGMLADKDSAGVLASSKAHVDVWCMASLSGPRGELAQTLAATAEAAGIQSVSVHDDVLTALAYARQQAGKHDRIVVFGSFYTVSAVLALSE